MEYKRSGAETMDAPSHGLYPRSTFAALRSPFHGALRCERRTLHGTLSAETQDSRLTWDGAKFGLSPETWKPGNGSSQPD